MAQERPGTPVFDAFMDYMNLCDQLITTALTPSNDATATYAAIDALRQRMLETRTWLIDHGMPNEAMTLLENERIKAIQ